MGRRGVGVGAGAVGWATGLIAGSDPGEEGTY